MATKTKQQTKFYAGDRLKGVSIDTDQAIEGIVIAVGRKYLRLDGDKRSVFKATAEMLEPGERVIIDDEDEPVLPPKPGTRMSKFRERAKAVSLRDATDDDDAELLHPARIDSQSEVAEDEPETFEVSPEDLEQFSKLYSAHKLIESKICGVFSWDDREWVCTGTWGDDRVEANQVAPLSEWDSEIHTHATLARRKNGTITLKGLLVKYRRRELVFTGKKAKFVCSIDADNKPAAINDSACESLIQPVPLDPIQSRILDSTPVEIIPSDPRQRLDQLENDIQTGAGLVEQGESLIWRSVAQIQAEELWKLDGYDSFEDYGKRRWGWERSNTYNNAVAGKVVVELEQAGISEAQMPTSVSQTLELKKAPPEQRSTALKMAIESTGGKTTAKAIKTAVAQLQPPVCKPSITPEEFNREMAIPSAARFGGCHSCRHRKLTDSGDRFSCRMEEFDEALERRTLGIREDWAEMNEGCKSFSRPESAAPNYPVPAGVLRLKPTDGGHEVFGLVLSHDRFCRLAKLARSLDGTLATALFELIDQLPMEGDHHD